MAPALGPQTHYSDILPEAVNSDAPRSIIDTASLAAPQSRHLSLRMVMIISVTVATIVVGLAVGLGVGVGFKQRRTIESGPIMPANTVTRTASPECVPPQHCYLKCNYTDHCSPAPSPVIPFREQQVLNDTSLAAVELPDSDRRVFFQDNSGLIRQASFSSSNSGWRADIDNTIASNAKNHTPIAAMYLTAAWSVPFTASGSMEPNAPGAVGPAIAYMWSWY